MYKFFLLIAFSTFSFFKGICQDKDELSLQDFVVEETRIEDKNASIYQLSLQVAAENISVRLFAEPKELVDSYLDEKYLVLLYRDGATCYLTGAFKEDNQWKQDYFHQQLGFSTGLFEETIKSAEFLDGVTLRITYEQISAGKRNTKTRQVILRICADDIYEYQRTEEMDSGQSKTRNSIRPKE